MIRIDHIKCRIVYIHPVPTGLTGEPVQTALSVLPELKSIIWSLIKAVGIGQLIDLLLVEIWARFWFICALDDVRCSANTPRL